MKMSVLSTMRARGFLIFLTTLLGACATPNLQPFADQTSNLASAVAVEQKQIAAGWDFLTATLDAKQKEPYMSEQTLFTQSATAINHLLQQAVAYSDRLAELAAAGEKGADAASSLIDTVTKFGAAAGIPGVLVTEAAGKVLKEISEVATRIQAQKTLEKATSEAQPAVESLAQGIEKLEKEIPGLVRTLGRERSRILKEHTGPQLIGLYEDVKKAREPIDSGLRMRVRRFTAEKGFCVDDQNNPDPRCVASREFQAIEALNNIVVPIRPIYDDYIKGETAIKVWVNERVSKSKDISSAAAAWAQEHKKIADMLEKCGGFRALKCQDLNLGSLKVAVDKLKAEIK
jgi:hypothetical protein